MSRQLGSVIFLKEWAAQHIRLLDASSSWTIIYDMCAPQSRWRRGNPFAPGGEDSVS